MVQLYPAKTFFKVISNDSGEVQEIDYIKVQEDGTFYIEKHKDNNIEIVKLVEEK